MSAQIIALVIFWRFKAKKKSKAEIIEKKRQLLEVNFELESDGSHDASRMSQGFNDSIRDTSMRGTDNSVSDQKSGIWGKRLKK